MTAADTCTRCGAPGYRTLGAELLCAEHHEAVLAPIRDRVADRGELGGLLDGHGRSTGTVPAGHAAGLELLECDRCFATWVDTPGAGCPWCARRYARLLADQAELDIARARRNRRPETPSLRDVVDRDLVEGLYEDGAGVEHPDRYRPDPDPMVESLATELEEALDTVTCRRCLASGPRPAIYGHDCDAIVALKSPPATRSRQAYARWLDELAALVDAGRLRPDQVDAAWRKATAA